MTVELEVPCSEATHKVRVRLESWEQWKVITTECMEIMGRALGMMAACYHNTKERGCELRLQAVEHLSEARAVPLLIQALQDENYEVRAMACCALGKIGDASAVPALTQALKDRDKWVREAASAALDRTIGGDSDGKHN